jgi:flavin-dependent dehydrogenase
LKTKTVTIIGGGLAGLFSALQLARAGITCTLVEKRQYPFHRVCGEYVSNEVLPFLHSLQLFPNELSPASIQRFQLSSISGKSAILPLDLGGFGISRFALDHYIYEKAKAAGVHFLLDTEATNITFENDLFTIDTPSTRLTADVVIGSFGKRSRADVALERSFLKKRSPYVGVKYHVRTSFPEDLVALHNFEGGYCGTNSVESGIVNICYLIHRDVIRKYGSVTEAENAVLIKNPHLKEIFKNSDFLFKKPEVINEITFETKEPVYNHVLMTGDAAGMITPLCGNGMAIAIHSSKLVSELVIRFCKNPSYSRTQLEQEYARQWKSHFANRLWFGRQVQKLFGSSIASNAAIHLALYSKPIARAIVKGTHGKPF